MPNPRIGHVSLAVIAVLAGCHHEPPHAVVGLADDTTAMPIARAAIDSSNKPGDPAIEIISQPPPGHLVNAVSIARRFTEHSDAVVEVGPPGSGNGLLTAPIFDEAHIVQLLSTATDPQIRTSGSWTFMLAPDDTAEARFLAQFVWSRFAPAAVSIFYVRDPYGVNLSHGIATALSDDGVRVDRTPVRSLTYTECVPRRDGNVLAGDVQAALTRLRPSVVVLATRIPETACLIAALRSARVRGAIVVGDGAPLSEMAARFQVPMDSVYAVDLWMPSAGEAAGADFVSRFEARYHRLPRASEALTYDALMLAAAAIRTVGVEPRDVREYLQSLGHERPPYHGVTGAITFPASADRLVLVQITGNGQLARVARNPR